MFWKLRIMRWTFYSNLYAAEDCDNDCMIQLFQGLPQLNCDSKTALDANITFKEVSDAVANLNIGRSNGMYGLLADFYKSFWSCIGKDLFDVFLRMYERWCFVYFLSICCFITVAKKSGFGSF